MLLQAFIYLAAAALAVPVARRLGLGSVLGYLIAGAAIGPMALDLVGPAETVGRFAEFGVVMLLFLVGLELRLSDLWAMRARLLGLGGLQVGVTSALLAALGVAAGLDWRVATAGGVILALSSTAIIVQTLQEKKLMGTPGGQATFSILLFQALAVIPILALWPLLGTGEAGPPGIGEADTGAAPGWLVALRYAGALAVIIGAGRYLIRPLFRFIARSGLRELFTVAALLVVVGIAAVTEWVGLSAALGTFIGGVLLADSEYRHELVADIEPFKGLLLGLFFITVGASLDFALIAREPAAITALLGAMVVVKSGVLLALGRLFRLGWDQTMLLALVMIVGDEFAFVLIALSQAQGVLGAEPAALLTAAVALSMALTPLLFLAYEKLVVPRLATGVAPARAADEIDPAAVRDNEVIIAGFGRIGHVVGRMLGAHGRRATVLDLDSEHVEVIRKLGFKVFYGDATRLDLLHAAGAARAKVFVVAIDRKEKSLELVDTLQTHFPHLTLLVRAEDRLHAYELQKRGVEHFYREMLGSALDLGEATLRQLGHGAHEAHRSALTFKRHDEAAVRALARHWEDDALYFSEARKNIEAFEKMFEADRTAKPLDPAWNTPPAEDDSRG
jgi:monovalent cation:proton antiporter-2 (CPA2) family protein